MRIDGNDIWEAKEETLDLYLKSEELSHEERLAVSEILNDFIARLIVKSRP